MLVQNIKKCKRYEDRAEQLLLVWYITLQFAYCYQVQVFVIDMTPLCLFSENITSFPTEIKSLLNLNIETYHLL